MAEGWIRPDPRVFKGDFWDNPSIKRALGIIAEAVPSLGAAIGTSVVTGQPWAGAAFLGGIEGAPMYHEAKEAEKSEVAACFQDLLNNYHPVPTQTSPSQFPGSSHRDETHPAKGSSPRVGSSDFFAQFGV